MADFPQSNVTPLLISSWSRYSAFADVGGIAAASNFTGASFTWPAANRGVYIPLFLPWPYPVKRVFWGNGSGTLGNADFGIYTVGGAQIYHTGSTAQSGNSALQYVTPTEFLLPAGRYFMALAYSGTTNVAWGSTNGNASTSQRMAGCYQQASSVPLPAAATFASFASNAYPLCGITRTTTGF